MRFDAVALATGTGEISGGYVTRGEIIAFIALGRGCKHHDGTRRATTVAPVGNASGGSVDHVVVAAIFVEVRQLHKAGALQKLLARRVASRGDFVHGI